MEGFCQIYLVVLLWCVSGGFDLLFGLDGSCNGFLAITVACLTLDMFAESPSDFS